MRSGNKAKKTYQTTWKELLPWVEQLSEDHGVRVDVHVYILAEKYRLLPTIEVEAYKMHPGAQREVIRREYTQLEIDASSSAEAMTVRMVSRILLDLENEKERAERQTDLFAA